MTFPSTQALLSWQRTGWQAFQVHPVSFTVGSLLAVVFATGIYNRYLHPLRRFPGPFWATVTSFHFPYLLTGKLFHIEQQNLHERYGSVVRIAPNMLAFSDPRLLPDVYHSRVDKTGFYNPGMLGDYAPLFQILDSDEHTARRKALSPTYAMKHALLLETAVDHRVSELNQTLKVKFADTGTRFNWAEWNRYFMYDVISQFIYGTPIGFLSKGTDVEGLIGAWQYLFNIGGLMASMPWLIGPTIFNTFSKKFILPYTTHGTQLSKIHSYHDGMFEKRLNQIRAGQPGNLFDSLLKSKFPDGSIMTTESVKNECLALMIASQDSTAAFVAAFINNLIQHPRVYKKLNDEISAFEQEAKLSSPVVKFTETNTMPFFLACAKETLRLHPSTPIILPRRVSKGGVVLNGILVPENSEIGANPYIIHRDKDVFGKDAETFRPERWLEDPERSQLMDRYTLAWGYGSRMCLGKNIAQVETHKLLVQFLRDFNVRSFEPRRPWKEVNWAIAFYFEQWIIIEERKRETTDYSRDDKMLSPREEGA